MQVLDEHRASVVRSLCDLIVPGSARVHPEVYIDALLARIPPPDRDQVIGSFDALEEPAQRGAGGLAEHVSTPEFAAVRALACEAFYSDFVAPGVDAGGAWEEIGFSPPVAARLAKDWSYLGVTT
jgi:hypothetical protein